MLHIAKLCSNNILYSKHLQMMVTAIQKDMLPVSVRLPSTTVVCIHQNNSIFHGVITTLYQS